MCRSEKYCAQYVYNQYKQYKQQRGVNSINRECNVGVSSIVRDMDIQ